MRLFCKQFYSIHDIKDKKIVNEENNKLRYVQKMESP